ncbi:werner syndrome-like exonuclease [Phtheirospermum japonicum]|uniref:3'-5' exonuclease n=1 Tax=Phtheirospermum japonicum TaxID=374723 RepID=A0A830CWJ5_9LAMI|nr:werner syndrome-like exonuclease [Phtheirospermum japonicum]
MGSEIPGSDTDWDYPLTDEDLRAIDSAFRSAAAPKRHALSGRDDEDGGSAGSPPKTRRRLPDSLFVFQHQQNNDNSNNSTFSFSPCSKNRFSRGSSSSHLSTFQEIKFGGRIIYSRTVEEVERAAKELLDFVEAKKRKEGQCILGLDIEWRASFRRGVAPGKAAVMQICGDNSCCHVLHIIHSGIPKNLQTLLEDCTSLKVVGVCIANDAAKVLQDHNVSINSLGDLSDLANQKLSGDPKKWSLSSLTEMLICRKLPKPNKIRLGNWEVDVLSMDQIKYAATDAYVSWYLYQVLKNHPDPAGKTSVEMVVN